MFTDLELINQVKELNDSNAISELVNRHSGCYLQVVNKYCSMSSGKLSYQDLAEDRIFNIYRYAQTYNPDKGCKFPTYVSNMTRYTCLDLLKHEPDVKEYLDAVPVDSFSLGETISSSETTNENLDQLDLIRAIDLVVKGKNLIPFKKILKLRHSDFIKKPLNWVEIGKKVGMSHEGARKLYFREIEKIKSYLNNK